MSSCGLSLEHDPEKEFSFSRRIKRQDKIESMTMSHIVSSRSGGQPGRRSRRRRLRFLRERILNIAARSRCVEVEYISTHVLDIGYIQCLIDVIASKNLEQDLSEKPDPLLRILLQRR
jgi:hypothetical protein